MEKVMPYLVAFFSSLIITLVLTPLVREFNRKIGMVDKPDPRLINKVPIPRGGGIAIVAGVYLGVVCAVLCLGKPAFPFLGHANFMIIPALAISMALIGYIDDKFSLPPKVKLLGQIIIAVLTWVFADVGFRGVFDWMPAWLDCIVTTFWIIGAVNAFNLIDGLDGLATGLALIASIGMGGSLFFTGDATQSLFYFFFAGSLFGFLRYNYNPASVFMGDSGSMYIGYTIATLPLLTHHASPSFLVSVGVPLLAMGVPIFDTSLAIIRRSIRHLIARKNDKGEGQVMTADKDHLHHRLLRATGLNQKKAVWTLYAMATGMVLLGIVAMSLKSAAGGIWLLGVTLAAFIIFKDMYRVELYDAGRFLSSIARDHSTKTRRRMSRWALMLHLIEDVIILVGTSLALLRVLHIKFNAQFAFTYLPIRVFIVFLFLSFLNTYRTIWSRALLSNYLRLVVGICAGTLVASAINYYLVPSIRSDMIAYTIAYALCVAFLMVAVRNIRAIVRDLYYAINSNQMRGRKDVSRILVYGSGLRYRAFRRELVRSSDAANRFIVGIIDDDLLLKNKYIGGIRILGTIFDAPEAIKKYNVDTVVIACQMEDDWLKVALKTLKPTGVKVTMFNFIENEL